MAFGVEGLGFKVQWIWIQGLAIIKVFRCRDLSFHVHKD